MVGGALENLRLLPHTVFAGAKDGYKAVAVRGADEDERRPFVDGNGPSVVEPLLLLASLAVVVLGLNSLTEGGAERFPRGDGLMLLLLFCLFLHYTLSDALHQRDSHEVFPSTEPITAAPASSPGWRLALMIIGGLLLSIVGGELTVRGGGGLAGSLGVSEVIIGLTVIAVGTSLPELATTISAARRGNTDLAVGNIVGSNISNLYSAYGSDRRIVNRPIASGTDHRNPDDQ